MSLFRTLAMLTTASLIVFFFYCVGHALAVQHAKPVIVGVVSLAIAAALLFLQVRGERRA